MTEFVLHHGTWIAVCDGSNALLLKNVGDRFHPSLEMHDVIRQENLPTHLQGTSQPGRAFSSADGRRAAMEESDFHAQAEEAFIRAFALKLDRHVQGQRIDTLLLIAPANALGILRKALSDATRRVLRGDLVRDYAKLPLHEIERHLTDLQ